MLVFSAITPRPSDPTSTLTSPVNKKPAVTSPQGSLSFPETFYIKTAYYAVQIPLWHSPLPDDLPAWKQEWLGMEGAGEVVKEIAAWIIGFEKPGLEVRDRKRISDTLQAVHEVIRHHMGIPAPSDEVEPPLLLAIGLPGKDREGGLSGDQWDDLCRECGGWEYIDGCLEERGKSNEYGGEFAPV